MKASIDTWAVMKWQLLHNACWAGDAPEVTRVLDTGADPNPVAPTNWRQTPLGHTLEFRITSPGHAGCVEPFAFCFGEARIQRPARRSWT